MALCYNFSRVLKIVGIDTFMDATARLTASRLPHQGRAAPKIRRSDDYALNTASHRTGRAHPSCAVE
jgi:hypothetical protein